MNNEDQQPTSTDSKSWPDYRSVWRWHFYASLFCMPFVIALSLTGAIYLFKPQIDRWEEREFNNIATSDNHSLVSVQVQAAIDAYPNGVPTAFEFPSSDRDASRVLMQVDGKRLRVFVHPTTNKVLGDRVDNQGFIRWIRSLHGQLNMGTRGSNLVELASSWTMIMLITGLYLWWPRSQKTMGGILYPRFQKGSKIFWRDIHSVTGIWISFFAIFLLATGLPWAKFWGSYFKTVREMTGTAVVKQDWSLGGNSEGASGHAGHEGHSGAKSDKKGAKNPPGGWKKNGNVAMPSDLTCFDRVAAAIGPLKLAYPASISPPGRGSANWTAKSDAQNRPLRTTLEVDGATGEILIHEKFSDRHILDQIVGYGIAAHEGQLFGIANQLLGLLTALGLILLSVSGYVMWWRRREPGKLGAPDRLINPRFSLGLLAIVLLLAVYMPMFGATVVMVLILEKILLSRIGLIRNWLGLQKAKSEQ